MRHFCFLRIPGVTLPGIMLSPRRGAYIWVAIESKDMSGRWPPELLSCAAKSRPPAIDSELVPETAAWWPDGVSLLSIMVSRVSLRSLCRCTTAPDRSLDVVSEKTVGGVDDGICLTWTRILPILGTANSTANGFLATKRRGRVDPYGCTAPRGWMEFEVMKP